MDREVNFWIGLSDVASEGDWRLASNGLKPSYLNWHKGEPNNHRDEDCARMRTYSRQKDTWADAKCDSESLTYLNYGRHYFHALCEYDSLTTNSTKGA